MLLLPSGAPDYLPSLHLWLLLCSSLTNDSARRRKPSSIPLFFSGVFSLPGMFLQESGQVVLSRESPFVILCPLQSPPVFL